MLHNCVCCNLICFHFHPSDPILEQNIGLVQNVAKLESILFRNFVNFTQLFFSCHPLQICNEQHVTWNPLIPAEWWLDRHFPDVLERDFSDVVNRNFFDVVAQARKWRLVGTKASWTQPQNCHQGEKSFIITLYKYQHRSTNLHITVDWSQDFFGGHSGI